MKTSIYFIFISLLISSNYVIDSDYGSMILDGELYETPFLGGFNKPKIQWIDWNNDGDDELFLLDEDGSIKLFDISIDENIYNLVETNLFGISNISWFYIGDFDLDEEYEIVTQDPNDINQMLLYDIINDNLIEIGSLYDSSLNPVESDGTMIPTFCDIDNDNDLDFFTGNMVGTITYYENTGMIENYPSYELITNFWEEIYIVGPSQSRHGASAITFIDIDNDDDYDLSWGDYYQQSLYIVFNQGSVNEPDMDNINIVTEFPPNNPISTAGLNMPTFSDIDQDGDNDLFVTVLSGAYGYQLKSNFYFFENDADQSSNYILQTSDFIKTLDLLSDVTPALVDINNDDKIDLFIGTDFDPTDFPWTGKINYFSNSGDENSSENSWTLLENNFIEQDLGNNLAVDFSDIDGDEDQDLFVGNYNGVVQFFENVGDIDNSEFMFIENISDIDLSGYSIPRLIDIDNDSDNDLFVGGLNGNISFYENIGTPSSYNFSFVTDNFENINVGSRSAPEFIDMDNDGDFDLIIGSQYEGLYYYENDGSNYSYNFQYNENIDFPFLGLNTVPACLNNKEILVGISTGGLYYLSTCNHPDINNDSFVNVSDVILIVNFIIDQSIEDYLECSYDLNTDDVINVIDIIYLVNLILS